MPRLLRVFAPLVAVTVLTASQTSASSMHHASLPMSPLHAAKLLFCTPQVKGCPHPRTGWENPCYRFDPKRAPLWSKSNGCPITHRLQKRLRANPTSDRRTGADPVCRCQMAPRAISFGIVPTGAGPAYINLMAKWTATDKAYFTLVVVKRGKDWVVDDILCTYRSHSSIYDSPVKSC